MKSIQTKISVFMIALIFATAVLLSAITLTLFYNSTLSQMKEDTQALSKAYSLSIRQQIQSFQKELQMAAALEGLSAQNQAGQEDLLKTLAAPTGFEYFALADGSGKTTRNSDISERVYFQKALGGTTYMSSPLINKVDGSVTIMMAAPINAGAGDYKVLYGGILYDTFSRIIGEIQIGNGGYAFVVDKEGTIVAHPDAAMVAEMRNYVAIAQEDSAYLELANVLGGMISGESGVEFANFDGERRLYAFTPVDTAEGWSVAVSVPAAQITGGIYRIILICLVAVAVLLLLGILIAMRFSHSITKPIVAVTHRLELLAEGNLSAEIPEIKGKDELARLSAALGVTVTELNSYIGDISNMLTSMAGNDFTVVSGVTYKGEFVPIQHALGEISKSLKRTLRIVSNSTEQVSLGAEQVASGAQALAAGSTEQAASVQQLSAAVESVAEQAEKSLAAVEAAAQYVEKAAQDADAGDAHMTQLTTAMADIHAASAQIATFSSVIEDIAFQTNILALNAAIEAARAGSAGKGFAVVADEVRNLAAKSAEAAKRTSELIQASVDKVSKGAELTGQTAKILQRVSESSRGIHASFSEIEQASTEQSEAISQIKEGLAQVSGVVQTNAATAEENSATSEEMSAQALTLRQEVGKFRLGERRSKPAESPPASLQA